MYHSPIGPSDHLTTAKPTTLDLRGITEVDATVLDYDFNSKRIDKPSLSVLFYYNL